VLCFSPHPKLLLSLSRSSTSVRESTCLLSLSLSLSSTTVREYARDERVRESLLLCKHCLTPVLD
jgi:hypothetical protein